MLISAHLSAPQGVLVEGLVFHNHTSDLPGNSGLLIKIGLKIGSFYEIF